MQMQALHDVVQAGYVRYIGMSSCHAYQCEHPTSCSAPAVILLLYVMSSPPDAKCVHATSCTLTLSLTTYSLDYAITHNLTPFISMQNHYSAVYREEEREMFPALKMFGVGSIPWSPLGRGVLTRPLSEQTKRSNSDVYVHVFASPQRLRSDMGA